MKVIEGRNLTKSYGNLKAVYNLTFEIEENKITGLIGRNGAGKTTLLKIMAGLLQKTEGELKVFSEEPFNNLRVLPRVIFIDDKMTFPSSLTLHEILESAESFYENWDQEMAKRLFDYFSFHPRQYHDQLSKGMKSTFNMIIGIAARCPLTIFDEPTTGMDGAVRKDFYRALLKDYIQNPRTIILSSHLLNEIEDLLEDVLLINQGQKTIHMAVEDLKEYAIGLRGKASIVDDLAKTKEVLYREAYGIDSAYIVIRNEASKPWQEKVKLMGIELSPVSTNDLCVYLTARNKGGIDDVFNR